MFDNRLFALVKMRLDQASPRFRLIGLALFAGAYFAFCQTFAFSVGPTITTDGYRDSHFAEQLIALRFNPMSYYHEVTPEFARFNTSASGSFEMNNPVLPYILYIYVVAFCKLLAGEAWLHVLVFLNATAQTATGIIGLVLAAQLSRSILPPALIAAFLFFAYEFYQWTPLSQSTPIFLVIVSLVFALAVTAWSRTDQRTSRSYWLGALVLSLACIFTRPSAPPVVAMIVIGWLLCSVSQSNDGSALPKIRKGLVVLLTLLFGGVLVHGFMASDPSVVPAGTLRNWIEYFRDSQAMGWIMWRRPETFVSPPVGGLDFAATSLLRGGYFFVFVVDSFSTSHTVFNIAFFLPLYGLSIIGAFAALRSTSDLSHRARGAGILAILMILLTASFVAVTYLDYDWRYRVPTLPAFLVLAAIGADRIIQRYSST